MNYNLHSNGWTIISDFKLKNATQQDIIKVANLVAKHTCIVFKNQNFTIEEELAVVKMFGDPEYFGPDTDKNYIHRHVEGGEGLICRVTGELNEHGISGIAGYVDEMKWHCNHPYRRDRRPLVWLYGKRGTKNSTTSWNNTVNIYKDLSNDKKEQLKNLKAYMLGGIDHSHNTQGTRFTSKELFDVVHTNNANQTGLYFPFLQIDHFEGYTATQSQEIIQEYIPILTNPKYVYDHHWEDGDLVISEQWLGIHRRHPCKNIATRVLHRAVFDFPKELK